MSAPAAIKATFSDFRIVKGRKVAQLVFETPIEAADAALATLGGLPRSDREAWCGIALLDLSHASDPDTGSRGIMNVGLEHHEADKPKRKFDELPIAQRAALLCNRRAFWTFINEREGGNVDSETIARAAILGICRISSRSELSMDRVAAMRFNELEIQFENWLEGHGF